MKKEFQYMNRDEKIKLLQKTAESFVDKESYTRQKFIGLFLLQKLYDEIRECSFKV